MVDLLQIIENLKVIIGDGTNTGLTRLAFVLCWIFGVSFALMAIKQAVQSTERGPQGGGMKGPLVTFLVAVCFTAMPSFLSSMSYTIFGQMETDPSQIFSYTPATVGGLVAEGTRGRTLLVGIATVVKFIGLIAIMRGLFFLRSAALPNAQIQMGPGVTFVIAGICAWNFPLFLSVLENLVT